MFAVWFVQRRSRWSAHECRFGWCWYIVGWTWCSFWCSFIGRFQPCQKFMQPISWRVLSLSDTGYDSRYMRVHSAFNFLWRNGVSLSVHAKGYPLSSPIFPSDSTACESSDNWTTINMSKSLRHTVASSSRVPFHLWSIVRWVLQLFELLFFWSSVAFTQHVRWRTWADLWFHLLSAHCRSKEGTSVIMVGLKTVCFMSSYTPWILHTFLYKCSSFFSFFFKVKSPFSVSSNEGGSVRVSIIRSSCLYDTLVKVHQMLFCKGMLPCLDQHGLGDLSSFLWSFILIAVSLQRFDLFLTPYSILVCQSFVTATVTEFFLLSSAALFVWL